MATALLVALPYAAPYVLTGAKLAVAYSLIGIIGAEFIMSRGGMGYEISFAYTNFDNATMYPLILLVLAVSIAINARAVALGKDPAGAEGPVRTDALRSARNGLMLVVGLLLAWQCLYWFAGEIAMRSPLATVRFHREPRGLRIVLAAPVGDDARLCGRARHCGRGSGSRSASGSACIGCRAR